MKKTLLTSLSLCFIISAPFVNGQVQGNDPGAEEARRNFSREIVLDEDDVRMFPDAPEGFNSERSAIDHGRIEEFRYESGVTGTTRVANVYLPPHYSNDETYPVLYLLHGIGGDETEWIRFTRPNAIFDNLIADGKARPMVVVFPNGRALANDRAEGEIYSREKMEGFARFDGDLIEFLIPAIEAKYSVSSDRKDRALAGLSMGGGQTLNIGLTHLDSFAWLGAFSAAPNAKSPAELIPEPSAVGEKLELFYLSCGNKDALIRVSQGMKRYLNENNIPHIWNVDGFGHDAEHWGSNLYHFSQKVFR